MSRRRVSNPLALAVLACLSERPMHPYEISSTLRTRGKEQSIKLNYGALYSVVDKLQQHGLVEALEKNRQGRRPERTVYAITPAGSEEFEDWLAELLSTPAKEYSALEAGLSLMAGLSPAEVSRLLRERVTRLAMEIGGVDATLEVAAEQGVPELFLVEASYRRTMLEAERTFVTGLAEAIETDGLGGVAGWRRLHELMAEGMTLEEVLRDPARHLGEEGRMFAPPT